jgi:SPP1 family predicted phage head-tail adaptor
MNVGKMNKRIELQLNSEETAAYTTTLGGLSTTYATSSTVWASIEPLSGRELFVAQQAQSDVDMKVTIRYYSGLTTRYRVKFGSRYFGIQSIINTNEKNEEMILMCKEVS